MDGDSGGDETRGGSSSQVDTVVHHALNALVPRATAVTLFVLVAGAFATNSNNLTGSYNKAIYVAILVLGAVTTVLFLHNSRPVGLDAAHALFSALGLSWGIWTIERPGLLHFGYWEGFGYPVALASLVLLLVFAAILPMHRVSTRMRIALGVLGAAVCVVDVLGGIRTLDYMVFVNNNLNEVNDILGPAVGKLP